MSNRLTVNQTQEVWARYYVILKRNSKFLVLDNVVSSYDAANDLTKVRWIK